MLLDEYGPGYAAGWLVRLCAVVLLAGPLSPLDVGARPARAAPAGQTPPVVTDASPQQADALRQQGQALLDQGDPQGALAPFQQALARYQQLGNRANERAAFNSIGVAYYRLNRFSEAVDAFQQALTLARALGDRRAERLILSNLGDAFRAESQWPEAQDAYQQALAVARALGDQTAERGVLHNLGLVAHDQSQYDEALDYYQQALDLARALGDRPGERGALNNIGEVYTAQGQFARAVEQLQQALELARAIHSRAGEQIALNDIGLAYERLGDYAHALEALQQARAIAQETGDRAGERRAVSGLALAFMEVGQNARALEYAQQELDLARATGSRAGEEIGLLHTGALYLSRGQFAEALNSHERALDLAEALGDRANQAWALGRIAVEYRGLGEHSRALEFLDQALAIAREISARRTEAIALWDLGRTRLDLGESEQALAALAEALALARSTGIRNTEAAVLTSIAVAHERAGDLAPALDAYREAIAVREDVRAVAQLEELKTSLAEQAADVYQRTALLLLRLGQPADAFDLTERARARTFLDQLGNAHLDLTRGSNRQLVEQEQALRAEITALDAQFRAARGGPAAARDSDAAEALSAQLTARQRDYEALLTRLKLADPEAASLVSVAPLTLAEVQQLLDPNTTLLSYFVTPDETVAFVVTRAGFQTVELPVGEQVLRDTIARFRAFAAPGDAAPALQQLSDWLLAPLADQLSTPVVGVVPHGVLHYLPFAALSAEDRYLGEAHTLFTLPSASVLPFVQAKRKGPADRVLAMAESRPPGLPPLQFADVEVATIAQLYGTQPLLGAAATKAAFKTQAPNFPIVHLAAHGELNEGSPLFSRLFLAPDGADDGSLTVQDVYDLDLARTDLVVLSACETQLGAQSRGDDVVALNRAFVYAGSPSVIASLWSVDDQATAVLMAAFYQHLREGRSKAQALQAAQVETRAQYPHPYYWAPFVLTGDPGAPAPS